MKNRTTHRTRRSRHRTRRDVRRGVMVVFVACALVALLGFVALSVDLAQMHRARTELCTAADAVARAAAETVALTGSSSQAATAADRTAAANPVFGQAIELESMTFGKGEPQLDGTLRFIAETEPATAVLIEARPADGAIRFYFAEILQRLMGSSRVPDPAVKVAVVRPDREIVVVVDRASTMSDSEWQTVVDAVNTLLTTVVTPPPNMTDVRPTHRVGLFSYVPPPLTFVRVYLKFPDFLAVRDALEHLAPTNVTNIEAGIDGARGVLGKRVIRGHAMKTIVLLAHRASAPGTDPAAAVARAVSEGKVIHTIAFGNGADTASLEAFAATAGGTYAYAADAAALEETCRQLGGHLRRTLPLKVETTTP